MSRILHIGLSVLVILALGLALAPTARAVQASGSVSSIPSDFNLSVGEQIDVTIRVNNDSTDTPPDGVGAVPGMLTGMVVVTMACANSSCGTPLPGTLVFVPVVGNGCVASDPGIVSCAVDGGNPNLVNITVSGSGITLPAGGSVDIAVIRVQAVTPVLPPVNGKFFLRGESGPDDIEACSSVSPATCATGGAEGSTALFFPAVCGDELVQGDIGETCDPPGSPAGGNGNLCRNDCTVCGDGLIDAGEECDDGDGVDDDECTNACTTPVCGDGIVQPPEECDDGDLVNDDECTNACTTPVCGDGIVQPPEECDDGDLVNDDECTNACTTPVCGDGIIQPPEECDDGNVAPNDGCSPSCIVERCGNGIVEQNETCDPPGSPGGAIGNPCRPDCTVCGDGIVQAGEQCDDGNANGGDSCTNICTTSNIITHPCNHPCQSRIRFIGAVTTNDTFEFHGRVVPPTAIDPPNEAFSIVLSNVNGVLFSGTLPPGSLSGGGVWRFSNPGARRTGGLSRVRVAPRGDVPGSYKVDARGHGDLSAATLAEMTVSIAIGDDAFANTSTWTQTQNGWKVALLP